MTPDSGSVVEPAQSLRTAWSLQAQWSRAANLAKSRYVLWGRISLGMSILAAALATATGYVSDDFWHRALAAACAALLAVLAVIGRTKTGPAALRAWIRSRSASEGLKTEAYRYVTRTGPYATAQPEQILSERTGEIVTAVGDLNDLVAGVDATAGAPPSDPLTVEQYLTLRVDEQIQRFYGPRAAAEASLVRRYKSVELVLAVLGAAVAGWASAVSGSHVAPWGAVITTAMGSIAAHLAAGRHEYQVTTYTATRIRLQQLSDRFRDQARHAPADSARIDQLVSECEAVISVENQGWMAEWDKKQAPKDAS